MRAFLLCGALCVLVACNRSPSEAPAVSSSDPFESPDATFRLPTSLLEISGLGVLEDGRLVAVQDEEGVLFVVDPATGQLLTQVPFAGNGDYEGVERVGRQVFVIQSNGRLFTLTDDGAGGFTTAQSRLDLPAGCDAEGLTHDPTSGFLLVACKEQPGSGLADARAVYAFDLEGRRQGSGPMIVIRLEAIARREAAVRQGDRVLDRLSGPGEVAQFKPSALAVHPQTGQVWVLSSRTQAIAVMDRNGAVAAYHPLSARRYPQPEGLAFLPEGTLFVSSEAGVGSATLFRFAPGEAAARDSARVDR